MEIYLRKQYGVLIPESEIDAEKMQKLPQGESFRCKVTKQRNPRFLRKYRGLLRIVFNNLPEGHCLLTPSGDQIVISDEDDLHFHIKLQAGYYDLALSLGGKAIIQPRSIAFDKMDEFEFEEFYNKALDIILKYFLIGTDRRSLQEMVLDQFG